MQLVIQYLMLIIGLTLTIISVYLDNPLHVMQSHIEGTMWILGSIIYGAIISLKTHKGQQ